MIFLATLSKMKPGLNRVGLVLKNYCALLWIVSIHWKYNSNISGTCAANSKANFSSSRGCYTPSNRMANTWPKPWHN